MCRIFGHLHGDVPRPLLLRATEDLRHGGPDDQRMYDGPGWALGSTRLAVLDPGHGAQPYVLDRGSGGRILAVLNGEIYNHETLRASLEADGYRIPGHCDGAVLPALYERHGPAFAERLDGMFAIAVLDLRAEPTLVLATDGVGMKPLYYHADDGGGLTFASELPALRRLTGAGRSPWLPGLDEYLTTKAVFGERTSYDDLYVVPPSTTAVVTRERTTWHRRPPQAPEARTPHDAAATVRDLLRRETHRLARADVPIAAITSGGLDSGLVTALLAERVPELHGFHVAYRGDWPSDEREHARAVAHRAGVHLHEVELDPAGIPALLPEVVERLGQPNADPITVSTLALFRAVREAGFTVALTGDGADEVFGGYDRIRAAMGAGEERGDWVPGYVASLAPVPAALRRRLYSEDYRAYLATTGTAEERWRDRLYRHPGGRLDAITELEVGLRMPAYHLRRVDHLSMASAIEVRLPFCQPSVIAAGTALPPSQRAQARAAKVALTASAAGLLPESVRTRPKQPFTLPIAAMLRAGTPLFDYARDVLGCPDPGAGRLDPSGVRHLLDRHAVRPRPATALAIWSLAVHQSWIDQVFGAGRPAARVA